MSGGSDKQTTTTNTTAEPYEAAQPLLDKGMGDALSLYKKGDLVQPNTMSTVVPMANQTTAGLNSLQGLSEANTGGSGLSGQFQNIINSGGYNADQMSALQGIRDRATLPFDIEGNPAYAAVRKRAMDATSDAVNSVAAGMGRYGSGTHQGVLGREVGNVAANMDFNEYNNWLQRSSQAQNQLFNAGQQGQANMFDAFQGAQAPGQLGIQVGGAYEDLMGRTMNDQLRITNELQNLPLANIQALLGVAGGAGNYGNTMGTSTSQMPSNTFSNVLGAGLGGLSLLSAL